MKQLLICFLGLSLSAIAQDPFFTNSTNSLIHLNPSFSGSNGGIRAQSIYRNQWYSLDNPFITTYTSIDGYIITLKAGLALSYT